MGMYFKIMCIEKWLMSMANSVLYTEAVVCISAESVWHAKV